MSATKISNLIELVGANLNDLDLFAVVDTSDFTQSSSGSTKKIKRSELFAAVDLLLGDGILGSPPYVDLTARLAGIDANIAARANALVIHEQATDDSQVSRVRAYNSNNGTALDDVKLTLGFNAIRYEVPSGGFYGGGTVTQINIPEDGHYEGVANIAFGGGAGGYREVDITVNDSYSIAQETKSPVGGTIPDRFSVPFESDFSQGDYFRVKAYQNSGSGCLILAGGTATASHYSSEISVHKSGYWQNTNAGTAGGGGGTALPFTALPAPASWYRGGSDLFSTLITDLGVTVRTNSTAIITSIFSRGSGPGFTVDNYSALPSNNDYTHPVYVANSGDASYTITQSDWPTSSWNGDIEGVSIKIPAGAKWSGGTDFNMSVIQPDNYCYQLLGVTNISGGVINCQYGRRSLITGDGIPTNSAPFRGGVSEAGFAGGLGLLRADEWTGDDGHSGVINHALIVAVSGYLNKCYPAITGGRQSTTTDTNAPPMGMLIRLNPSFDITGSGLPTWQKRILTALRDYGAYITDNGGSTLVLKIESSVPYKSLGRSPTVEQHLDTTFSHVGTWNMMNSPLGTNAAWIAALQAMTAPSP